MGKKDRAPADDESGSASLKWRPDESGDAGRGALAKARAKELRKEAERRAAKKQERMQAKKSEGGEPSAGKSTAESEEEDDEPERKTGRPARPGGLGSSGSAVPPSKPKKDSICKFFLEGTCKRGAGCAFLHSDPASTPSAGAPDGGGDQPLAGVALPAEEAREALDVFPDLIWAYIMSQMETAADVARCGATCATLHDVSGTDGVWLALQSRIFGPSHPAREEMASYDARGLCEESDGRLALWRQAARGTPTKLTLPGVVALSLGRGMGVSVHEDRFVRLWAGHSGRRLGAGAMRQRPTCVDVSKGGGAAVVCDARGGVSLYSLEDGVERPAASFAPADAPAIVSCAWVYGERAGGGGGGGDAGGSGVGGADWAAEEEGGEEAEEQPDAGAEEGEEEREEEGGEEEAGEGKGERGEGYDHYAEYHSDEEGAGEAALERPVIELGSAPIVACASLGGGLCLHRHTGANAWEMVWEEELNSWAVELQGLAGAAPGTALSLARAGRGGAGSLLLASGGEMTGLFDLNRGMPCWSVEHEDAAQAPSLRGPASPSPASLSTAMHGMSLGAPSSPANGAAGPADAGARRVAFSADLKLAAVATPGFVALWDVRASGPAAALVRVPHALCVEMDDAWPASKLSVLAPAGGGAHLFDMRATSSRAQPKPLCTLARGRPLHCLAARGRAVVVAEAEVALHWSEPDQADAEEDTAGERRTQRVVKKKKQLSVNKMAGTGKTKMRYGSKR
jgi:hypothetical protein